MAPASSPKIAFDFSACAARTVGGFVRQATAMDGRFNNLEDSVKSLEEERRKIEAFKRELPLCMNLISNVIEELKKEMERMQSKRFPSVLEELMPQDSKCEENGELKSERDSKEKMNWMSSVQLWSDNSIPENNQSTKIEQHNSINKYNGSTTDGKSVTESSSLVPKTRSCGSAFSPYEGLSVLAPATMKVNEKTAMVMPDLYLASPAMKPSARPSEEEHSNTCLSSKPSGGPKVAPSQLSLQAQPQTGRKARRCWSPYLHRLFLGALQQLGGPQVATPKQIRELMQVDGLTNDEVKSHLQKYRLHTRKTASSSVTFRNPAKVMGGLWSPLDNCASTSRSGSPESSLQLTVSDRAISTTVGDSCEDEDVKSESYGWK